MSIRANSDCELFVIARITIKYDMHHRKNKA